jgi:fructose-bisphosphate aldolase class 1
MLGSGVLAARDQSALTLHKSLEDNRVVETRLSRSKDEGDRPSAYAVEDGRQYLGVSSQFPNVASFEL